MRDGVDYGTTKAGGTSTVEQVFNYGTAVSLAGPISAPGIALDADGNPWVAFSVLGSGGLEVHAATLNGSKWTDQVVARDYFGGGPAEDLAAVLDRCEHALGTFLEAAAAQENAAT